MREFGFSAVLVAVVAAWFDRKYLTRSSSIVLGRMGPAMLCPAVPQKLGDHPAPSFQVLQSAVLERFFKMAFYGIMGHFASFHIDHFFTLEQSMEFWCQSGQVGLSFLESGAQKA